MWIYEKRLQYPVRVGKKDVGMARLLITQYGGPDGELAASLRYLNQRYAMRNRTAIAILTDIATEEFAHLEMIATMVHKLIKDATPQEMRAAGLGAHYADHGHDLFYTDGSGVPFTASYFSAKGDVIANLYEDIDAEEKARAVYENLMQLTDDPDLKDGLAFLREREVVHARRFREVLERVRDESGDDNGRESS
jgi:spore coat protein JC